MRLSFTLVSLSLCFGPLVWRAARAQEAVALEQVEADTPPAPEPARTPPPGEDVMHPTAKGLRMTRSMAESMARLLVRDIGGGENGSFSKDQQERLARSTADRLWDLKLRHSGEGRDAVEHFYEMLLYQELPGGKRLTADQAREFSQRVGPGAEIVREFWEGLLEDGRTVLDPEQYAKVQEKADEALELTRKFTDKMDRWSRGEVKENESILDGIEDNEVDNTGKSPEYVRAERSARWRVNSLGPDDWRRFLNRATTVFSFDDTQKQAAEQILADYIEQAKEIVTPEWKAKALANRVQEQLRWQCPEEPLEPWIYRLEAEYKRMTEPVTDMGRAFRREVLAMVRPDQRAQFFEAIRKVGELHGMTADEVDVGYLFPPVEHAATAPPAAADQGQ